VVPYVRLEVEGRCRAVSMLSENEPLVPNWGSTRRTIVHRIAEVASYADFGLPSVVAPCVAASFGAVVGVDELEEVVGLPTSIDLQVLRRSSIVDETATPQNPLRGGVVGQRLGLEPVEVELTERDVDDLPQRGPRARPPRPPPPAKNHSQTL
jgi:hypothetical protein